MNDISSFMHEIKNPLSNIYSLCDLINLENDIKSIKDLTAVLKQSIEQVINLEKEYNEYRKTYKSSVKPTCFLIDDLITSIINEYKSAIDKKNIKVSMSVIKKELYTDKIKLKQVLSNIISNAIKYNKKNGTIDISVYNYKDETYISIKDTGVGIKEKDLENIGMPFYRCKELEADGTGLGISLIKKICNKMNWTLSIESVYLEGTTLLLVI